MLSSRTVLVLAVSALVCPIAPAQVTLTLDRPSDRVLSSSFRTLTAAAEEGGPWTWTFELRPEDLSLGFGLEAVPGRPDQRILTVPDMLVEHTCQVRAVGTCGAGAPIQGRMDLAVHPLRTLGSVRGLMDQTFPGMFDAPIAMRPFHASLAPSPTGAVAAPDAFIRQAAFVTDPALGSLYRHWLVLDGTGFHAVSLQGDVVEVPWLPVNTASDRIATFAVRPPGSRGTGPALVYTVRNAGRGGGGGPDRFFTVSPGGKPAPMTLNLDRYTLRAFRVDGIAMNLDGDVFIGGYRCTETRSHRSRTEEIFRLDHRAASVPGGTVVPEDLGANPNFLTSMAFDPKTETLLLGEAGAISRIDCDGKGRKKVLEFPESDVCAPSLAVHGPWLLFAMGSEGRHDYETGAWVGGGYKLMAYNQHDSSLQVLARPRPDEGGCRFGPLKPFRPELSDTECAAFPAGGVPLGSLAVAPEGMAICGVGAELVELDLPLDSLSLALPPPESKAMATPPESKNEIGPAPASASSSSSSSPAPSALSGLPPCEFNVAYTLTQDQVVELVRRGGVLLCELGNAEGTGFGVMRDRVDTLARMAREAKGASGASGPSFGERFLKATIQGLHPETRDPLPSPLRRFRRDFTPLPDGGPIGFALCWSPSCNWVLIAPIQEHADTWDAYRWTHAEDGNPLTLEEARRILVPHLTGEWVPFSPLVASEGK